MESPVNFKRRDCYFATAAINNKYLLKLFLRTPERGLMHWRRLGNVDVPACAVRLICVSHR